jgi:hypothetical protein
MAQDERVADDMRQTMQGNPVVDSTTRERGWRWRTDNNSKVVATTMMKMTRINPCSGNNNAVMTTSINHLCTAMTMSNMSPVGA